MVSKLKKLFIIALVAFLLIAIIAGIANEYTRNYTLGGTYVCKLMPFDFISFDIMNGSDKFTYYHGNEQAADYGTFSKVADGVYILNSSIFKNEKLVCYKKFPRESGFYVKINGVEVKFVQNSNIPAEIVKPDQ